MIAHLQGKLVETPTEVIIDRGVGYHNEYHYSLLQKLIL
jgi:hypothetical protein